MRCPTCGSRDPDDCACVRRRTFRRTTVRAAIGLQEERVIELPQRYVGNSSRTEWAPRHPECRHLHHEPTDGRGQAQRAQNTPNAERRASWGDYKRGGMVEWDGAA